VLAAGREEQWGCRLPNCVVLGQVWWNAARVVIARSSECKFLLGQTVASGVPVVATWFVHLCCRTNRALVPAATNLQMSSRNLRLNPLLRRLERCVANG
jgi:hypothetical protein